MSEHRIFLLFSFIFYHFVHRHLRNIDCLSFVMCRLLAPVLIVNMLLFFFFFFCCGHLQNHWSKQGRRYALLSSQYYLDVYDQGILKGEVSLYGWPPVWLVWNQLYDIWQFLFSFAKQANPNRSPPLAFPAMILPLSYVGSRTSFFFLIISYNC